MGKSNKFKGISLEIKEVKELVYVLVVYHPCRHCDATGMYLTAGDTPNICKICDRGYILERINGTEEIIKRLENDILKQDQFKKVELPVDLKSE